MTAEPVPARRPARRRWPLFLRGAVAVGLCVWLATQVDWTSLGRTLAGVDPPVAVVALAVLWAGMAVAVGRWQLLLVALGSSMRVAETGRVFGSGLFLNLFLPTSIGGDVYRLARIQGGGFGPGRALVSLLAERGIGLLALLVLVAPAVLLHPGARDLAPLGAVLGGGALAAVAALRFAGGPIGDFLVRRYPVLAGVLGRDTRGALWRRAAPVFALSLAIHLSTVTANWALARGLGIGLSFGDALALVPLVVLAGQIPISPGGLGVREAGFVFFLGRVGIAKEEALAVGLAWLAALYLTGAVGAALFLLDRRSPAAAAGGAPRGASGSGERSSVGLDRAPRRP